jgi:hypothetical protein
MNTGARTSFITNPTNPIGRQPGPRPRKPARSSQADRVALAAVISKEKALMAARAQLKRAITNPFAHQPPCGGDTGAPSECITGTYNGSLAAGSVSNLLFVLSGTFCNSMVVYATSNLAVALSTLTPILYSPVQQPLFAPTAASGFTTARPLVGGLVLSVEDSANGVYPTIYAGTMPVATNFAANTMNQLINEPFTHLIPSARTAQVSWVSGETVTDAIPYQYYLDTGATTDDTVAYILLQGMSTTAKPSFSFVMHGDAWRGTTPANGVQFGPSNSERVPYSFSELFAGFDAVVEGAQKVFHTIKEHAPTLTGSALKAASAYRTIRYSPNDNLTVDSKVEDTSTLVVTRNTRPVQVLNSVLLTQLEDGKAILYYPPKEVRRLTAKLDPDGESLPSRILRLENELAELSIPVHTEPSHPVPSVLSRLTSSFTSPA